MADSKTYSSELTTYVDAELARAEREKQWAASHPSRDSVHVSESVSLPIAATIRANLIRTLILRGPSFAIALLPLLAVGASALLNAVGLGSFAGFPAPVALVGLALFLPWQAWQSIRRARGLAPWHLLSGRSRSRWDKDLPTLTEVAMPLINGLAAVPALFILARSILLPGFILWVLIALPVVLMALVIAGQSTLNALAAVGGVAPDDLVLPGPSASLAALDERIVRLSQMREWLRDDTLRTMVDDVIGHRVKASERRQVIYSVIVGAVSLAAGWLLSAVSPVSTLFSLLNH